MAVRGQQMPGGNEGVSPRAGHKGNRTLRSLLTVWSAIVKQQVDMRDIIVIAGYFSPTYV